MKIADPKLLHELYDIEAERKLLIGYRFKGSLAAPRKAKAHPTAVKPYRALSMMKARRAANSR